MAVSIRPPMSGIPATALRVFPRAGAWAPAQALTPSPPPRPIEGALPFFHPPRGRLRASSFGSKAWPPSIGFAIFLAAGPPRRSEPPRGRRPPRARWSPGTLGREDRDRPAGSAWNCMSRSVRRGHRRRAQLGQGHARVPACIGLSSSADWKAIELERGAPRCGRRWSRG